MPNKDNDINYHVMDSSGKKLLGYRAMSKAEATQVAWCLAEASTSSSTYLVIRVCCAIEHTAPTKPTTKCTEY